MNPYMFLTSHPLYSSVVELWRLRDSIHRVSNLSEVESILSSASKCYENPSLFCDHPIYDESSHCLLNTMAVLGHQILVIGMGFFDFDRSMQSVISSSLEHIREGLPHPCKQLLKSSFIPQSNAPQNVRMSDLFPLKVPSKGISFHDPLELMAPSPDDSPDLSDSQVSQVSVFEEYADSDSDFEKAGPNKRKRVKVSKSFYQGRAPRPNHSKEAKLYLREWLENHKSHPYPTEKEKLMLCEETGLNLTQMNNWFINARRRYI